MKLGLLQLLSEEKTMTGEARKDIKKAAGLLYNRYIDDEGMDEEQARIAVANDLDEIRKEFE